MIAPPSFGHADGFRQWRQSGFTLIELMVSLAILLVVIVATQRYVGGVLNDRGYLSAQQDQLNQTQIVLANLQHDLSRAGFTPLASQNTIPSITAVTVQSCTTSNCIGDELVVRYWTREDPAYDCTGTRSGNRTDGWSMIENTYRERSGGHLACSGGSSTLSLLDDVQSHAWTLTADPSGHQWLHLCLTTQIDRRAQTLGAAAPQDCTGGALPNGSTVYHTTLMDVLVRAPTVNALGNTP